MVLVTSSPPRHLTQTSRGTGWLWSADLSLKEGHFQKALLPLISPQGTNTLQPKIGSRNPSLDFPGGPVVKNPPAKAEDMGSIPAPGRSHMLRSH